MLLASCNTILVTNLPAWPTSPPPREKKKLAPRRFWSKYLRATVAFGNILNLMNTKHNVGDEIYQVSTSGRRQECLEGIEMILLLVTLEKWGRMAQHKRHSSI